MLAAAAGMSALEFAEQMRKRKKGYSIPQAQGGTGPMPGGSPMAPPPPTPAPPAEDKSGLMGFMKSLARPEATMAFNSMRTNRDPALTVAMDRKIQRREESNTLNNDANKTAQYLISEGRQDLADAVMANPAQGGAILREHIENKHAKPADSFKTLTADEVRKMHPGATIDEGLYKLKSDGSLTKIGGNGVTVNNQGSIPAGYQMVPGPNGVQSMQPIPGSPAAFEMEAATQKAAARQDQRSTAAGTVIQDLERMGGFMDNFAVQGAEDPSYMGSIGGAVSRKALAEVPGTPEYQANLMKESALSNVGIDQLMQIKQNSPTGGGLGQVPFQQQKRLEAMIGSLDMGQGLDTLQDNKNRIQNVYLDIVHGSRRQRKELLENGAITQDQFNAVESMYKPLTFDQNGIKYDISKPPPDFPAGVDWNGIPEKTKLMIISRYRNRENGY